MEGDGLSVVMGKGIEITYGETKFYLDPTCQAPADGITCVSHAHSDHMPSSFAGGPLICSDITLRCMRGRAKSKRSKDFLDNVQREERSDVKSFGAGHMLGSNMFMFDAGKKVLYTGDLCPQDRLDIEGARPQKCDVLIIESTYGNPRYRFPDRNAMIGIIRDWVEDTVGAGYSAVLQAYPLGKSQELISMLKGLQPHLHGSVLETTRMMEAEDLQFDYLPFDPEDDSPQLVLSSTSRDVGLNRLGRRRSANVSGWCLGVEGRSFGKMGWGMDQGFAYSDHADFYELIEFVRRCSPDIVYTHHGSETMLAGEIQKRLGITAIPLTKTKKGQSNLGCYC